ncbi:MAG TPA: acyloxyacyl hydrolase [Candidatus Hydrogenedens sp.]|nr:acyloxyacyl hydrolase [Candidatus Hydrogenedens sp.]HOL20723.1 acyloxyacyl hydrolase [Candidatus Hydrogenedens sp.]HPP59143.1 acyloxyacyl hydrolase [Candidatus Hydrogenedens sp.]
MFKINCLQKYNIILIVLFLVGISITSTTSSEEIKEEQPKNLRIRLGFENMFHAGEASDKADEIFFNPTIDIEKKVSPRTALSLRCIPAFFYIQDKNIEEVFGAGVGGTIRIYIKKEERGFFSEIHEVILFHKNKFEGNSSNINFYSSLGIGYQFNKEWDILFQLGHISNADLKENNKGTDLMGIGIGYTF